VKVDDLLTFIEDRISIPALSFNRTFLLQGSRYRIFLQERLKKQKKHIDDALLLIGYELLF